MVILTAFVLHMAIDPKLMQIFLYGCLTAAILALVDIHKSGVKYVHSSRTKITPSSISIHWKVVTAVAYSDLEYAIGINNP